MNILLTFLATAVVLVVPQSFSAVETKLNETWEIFKLKFGKKYDLATDNMRRIIWESNLKYIQHHNDGYKLGKYSYTLGMNQFTDLSNAEYRKIYLSPKLIKRNLTKSHFTHFKNFYSLPTSVDWRTQGYVTAVKDQGQCGSCWAFSTTGSLEGQNKRKTGNLVSFSEQQLIDCSQGYGNYGCSGGLMIFGFEYVEDNGIEAEADYPYTANDDDCQYDESKAVGTCTGYEFIEYGNEQDLAAAVATIGPISIAIDASNLSFQLYQDGVYDEPSCSSDSLDHGVLAIGYGNEHCIDYWLVKNSWGTTWGINGYIKMSKDKNNQCGVATFASYPLV